MCFPEYHDVSCSHICCPGRQWSSAPYVCTFLASWLWSIAGNSFIIIATCIYWTLYYARHCAQGLRVSFNPHNSPGGGEHHYYPAFIVSKQAQQLDNVASIPWLEDAEAELASVPPGCVFLTPAIASSVGAGMLPPACCGHPVCLTQPTILGPLGS